MSDDVWTREEHLAWCRERAMRDLKKGDLRAAVASMGSDLTKHSETKGMAFTAVLEGNGLAALGDAEGVRRWIAGIR